MHPEYEFGYSCPRFNRFTGSNQQKSRSNNFPRNNSNEFNTNSRHQRRAIPEKFETESIKIFTSILNGNETMNNISLKHILANEDELIITGLEISHRRA